MSVFFFFFLNVGAFLCRLCVSNVFSVKAGCDVDTSQIFLQGVLTAVTLIVVVAVGGFTVSAGCELGLSFSWGTISSCPVMAGSAPKLLKQKSWRLGSIWLFYFWVFFLLPHWDICCKGGGCWSQWASALTEFTCAACLAVWGSTQTWPRFISLHVLWLSQI